MINERSVAWPKCLLESGGGFLVLSQVISESPDSRQQALAWKTPGVVRRGERFDHGRFIRIIIRVCPMWMGG